MKISKERLQQIIAEEMSQIDEKINIKVGNSDNAIEKELGLDPNDDPWKDLDISNWETFAKQDNNPANITDKDFQAAFKKGNQSPNKRIATATYTRTKDPQVRDDLRKAQGISGAKAATALGAETLPSADDSALDKFSRSQRAASIPTVDVPYSGLVGQASTDVKGAVKLKAAGKLDPSTLDAFDAFYKIDPQIIGASAAGNTLEGRFELISKFAKLVKSKKASDIKLLRKLEPEDLMACGVVLKTLGSLFNMFQGASAGTIFEGAIALITGGVIYGGEGGAVDNLAGKNGDVYTSAKQYKDKHITSQALGGMPNTNSEGLISHCAAAKARNKLVWYISASKAEQGKKTDKISAVELLFVGVGVDDALKPTKFIFYNGDATPTGDEITIVDAQKAATGDKWDFTNYTRKSYTRFLIPFVEGGKDPSIANIDKMIASGLRKVKNAFLAAAMKANNEIDDIAKETLSYSTTADPDRAKTMRSKYMGIKKQFNVMFTEKGHTTIKENKKNEINSLKALDKLIEQVILYKNTEEK